MVFDVKKSEKSFKKERDLFLFEVFILVKQNKDKFFENYFSQPKSILINRLMRINGV